VKQPASNVKCNKKEFAMLSLAFSFLFSLHVIKKSLLC